MLAVGDHSSGTRAAAHSQTDGDEKIGAKDIRTETAGVYSKRRGFCQQAFAPARWGVCVLFSLHYKTRASIVYNISLLPCVLNQFPTIQSRLKRACTVR